MVIFQPARNRFLIVDPEPHVELHGIHALQSAYWHIWVVAVGAISLQDVDVMHFVVSIWNSSQFGCPLVKNRFRKLWPIPHGTEHCGHSDQGPYSHSATSNSRVKNMLLQRTTGSYINTNCVLFSSLSRLNCIKARLNCKFRALVNLFYIRCKIFQIMINLAILLFMSLNMWMNFNYMNELIKHELEYSYAPGLASQNIAFKHLLVCCKSSPHMSWFSSGNLMNLY